MGSGLWASQQGRSMISSLSRHSFLACSPHQTGWLRINCRLSKCLRLVDWGARHLNLCSDSHVKLVVSSFSSFLSFLEMSYPSEEIRLELDLTRWWCLVLHSSIAGSENLNLFCRRNHFASEDPWEVRLRALNERVDWMISSCVQTRLLSIDSLCCGCCGSACVYRPCHCFSYQSTAVVFHSKLAISHAFCFNVRPVIVGRGLQLDAFRFSQVANIRNDLHILGLRYFESPYQVLLGMNLILKLKFQMPSGLCISLLWYCAGNAFHLTSRNTQLRLPCVPVWGRLLMVCSQRDR